MKKTKEKKRTKVFYYRLTSKDAKNDVLTFDTILQCWAIQRISFSVVLIKFSNLMNFSSTIKKKWWRCWFCINWFHQLQNQSKWTIAKLVVYLINIIAFTSYSLIVFLNSAHSAHLRERVFIQHRLFDFKHLWQNVVASFLFFRIRSTMTWWLWNWLKFATFITNNLCLSRKWIIKWSNDEKKNNEKMLFYVQNYSFIFSHTTSFFIFFMIIDLRFRHIIFEQRVFFTSFSTNNENFFRFSFNIKTNIRIR
jgi:hypothetical protein